MDFYDNRPFRRADYVHYHAIDITQFGPDLVAQ
jgi:hypothetical protein